MRNLPFFQAVSTLVGTIIGAGILGVPYVFAQAGFLTATLMLLIVALAMVSMSLMFGEITLRTAGRHQLSGYVKKYLNKFWERVVSGFLLLAITGSLLAYFVGLGDVLAAILGGSAFWWGISFYLAGAVFIFFGIRLIKNLEFILTLGIFGIVLIFLLVTFNKLNFNGIFEFNSAKFFLPYGVLLFACSDLISIPQAKEVLIRREYILKKALIFGPLIPPVLYLLFAWIVVSITGAATTEVATVGLGQVLGMKAVVVVNVFAFFTIFTSLLTMGLALKEMYDYDFKLKHEHAWLLTVVAPLVFYLLGLRNFIEIISLVGALGFGINGVVYVFAYWRARKKSERKPEYALNRHLAMAMSVYVSVIFVTGLVYTLLDIF